MTLRERFGVSTDLRAYFRHLPGQHAQSTHGKGKTIRDTNPDEVFGSLSPVGGRYSSDTREKAVAALSKSEEGKAMLEFADKWQDAETSGRFRNQFEKHLNGELSGRQAEQAEAFASVMRASQGGPAELHRGLTLKGNADSIVAKYKQGDTLDLGLSSFTADSATASRYAKARTQNASVISTRVRVVWSGPKKGAIPLENLSKDSFHFKQKEWVGGGRFKVTSVTKSQGGVRIEIEQETPLA